MVTRDPIYDALKEHSKAKFDADRARFAQDAAIIRAARERIKRRGVAA